MSILPEHILLPEHLWLVGIFHSNAEKDIVNTLTEYFKTAPHIIYKKDTLHGDWTYFILPGKSNMLDILDKIGATLFDSTSFPIAYSIYKYMPYDDKETAHTYKEYTPTVNGMYLPTYLPINFNDIEKLATLTED